MQGSILLLFLAACTSSGPGGGSKAPDDSGGGGGGGDGAGPTHVALRGEIGCEGCGEIVVAVFSGDEGGPLVDLVLEGEGPFSFSLPAETGEVRLVAFADDNANHAPDPEEARAETGPHLVGTEDVDVGLIELGGGSAGSITVSGTLGCFEGCSGPLGLAFLRPGEDAPAAVGIVPDPGACSVTMPAGLGEVLVFAFEDLNHDRLYTPGEEMGAWGLETVEMDDLEGIDIEIALDDTVTETPGVLDPLGLPVAVEELVVALAGGTDAGAFASAAGLDLIEEIPGLGARLATGIEAGDADPLGDLGSLIGRLEAMAGAEAVYRSAWLLGPSARESDDNALLFDGEDQAYTRVRAAAARDLYHDCAIHFDAAQRSRTVEVAVVDYDLQAARDHSELSSLVASFTDHHRASASDLETHGTHGGATTAVIGARNDGAGMNGVLAGFRGTADDGTAYAIDYRLHLYNLGHSSTVVDAEGRRTRRITTTTGALIAGVGAALSGPATVTNLSIGAHARDLGHLKYIAWELRPAIERLLDAHSDRILVLGAANDGLPIDNGTHFSSMDRPNLLVVGGIDELDGRWTHSNHGTLVDIAAPSTSVYTLSQPVDHVGTSTSLGAASYAAMDGTSFAGPLVTANVALIQALDPAAAPSTVRSRLLRAADEGPEDVGGAIVNTRRTVQFELEQQLNTTTSWILELDAELTSISGSGCSTALSIFNAVSCMPLIGEESFSLAPGIVDVEGNAATFAGSFDGSSFSLTVAGYGSSFGVGPATTVYTGTASADPYDPLAAEGDVYLSGTLSGDTLGHPSLHCQYEGVFEAWLRRSSR